ncbi:hypothetical protein ACF1BQ_025455 [Bradyrhizobium sp. RDT10]
MKPMVRAALEAGGSYIVICGRPFTNSKIKAREKRISEALISAGLTFDEGQIQFRDADQVAQWVSSRPPVAAWLLGQTQPGLVGAFQDWSHWAGRYDQSPWVDDARLPTYREELRQLIARPREVVRVVGLSGYGKSRLTNEALCPTDEEEAFALRLSDLVMYAVETEAGAAQVKALVQALADSGARAIVVVDRCPEATHQDLSAMVKRSSSRLSLITIDHELPNDGRMPSGSLKIDRADDAVIDGMIKQIAPGLPSEDQRRLVKFSQGFPQMAKLLGQAWLSNGSIAAASDQELFDRIIVGRTTADPALLREVGMLVGAFGLIGIRAPLKDLEFVSSLSRGRSEADLRAGVDVLIQRGVAQEHGRLVSLHPKPLAMSLAETQWRQWSEDQWERILAGDVVPISLRQRAVRQLAFLNERSIATKVAKHLCRLNGPFASRSNFEVTGVAEIVPHLAEIDAETVLTLLEHVFGELDYDQLRGVKDDLRRSLVRALEKIAFLKSSFERAALLMLKLAIAENESWGNNATGQFKALFPVFLADTEADGEMRLRMLDELIDRDDPSEIPFVVEALAAGANHIPTPDQLALSFMVAALRWSLGSRGLGETFGST